MVSLWRPETAQVSDLSPSLASLVLGDRTVCLQVENRKRSRCESIPQKWACAMTCELWSPRVNRLETTISSSEEFPTVLTVVVGETETILIGQLLQLPGSFWGIYELKVKERERRGYRLPQKGKEEVIDSLRLLLGLESVSKNTSTVEVKHMLLWN